jgi:hypothetical protein
MEKQRTFVNSMPKVALRALIELTGQSELDLALLATLRDALEHRLEKIDEALETLEGEYGMSFAKFEAQGRAQKLLGQFSYEVERDYFEWDSLVTRKRKLQEIAEWLI